MRNLKSLTFLGTAAALLLACGSDGAGGGGGSTLTIPQCTPGQVLSTDVSGQLVCASLPSGAVSLPTCDPNTGALTTDGKQLSCTALNVTDSNVAAVTTTLNTVQQKITDLQNQVTVLGGKGGQASVFVGTSAATNINGAITDANGNKGVAAAANACSVTYAGSHECTVYEIYYSVATGVITPAMTITPSWVYLEAWTHFAGLSPTEPTNGLNENCAGQTYPTGDQQWKGILFTWAEVAFTGRFAPKWTGPTNCSSKAPIACCK